LPVPDPWYGNGVDTDEVNKGVDVVVLVVVVEGAGVDAGIKVVVVDVVMAVVVNVFDDFEEQPDIIAIKRAINPTNRQ
jgi:hypothetical protein